MPTLEDIERLVELHRDECFVGDPVPDDLIQKAEAFLGVRFPDDYRAFLKKWDTLALGPIEIYGVTSDSFESGSVPNGIWLTNRKRVQLSMPNHLVILASNEGVEYFCLDTSDPKRSEVVIFDVGSRQVRATRADSLFEFILNETDGVFDEQV